MFNKHYSCFIVKSEGYMYLIHNEKDIIDVNCLKMEVSQLSLLSPMVPVLRIVVPPKNSFSPTSTRCSHESPKISSESPRAAQLVLIWVCQSPEIIFHPLYHHPADIESPTSTNCPQESTELTKLLFTHLNFDQLIICVTQFFNSMSHLGLPKLLIWIDLATKFFSPRNYHILSMCAFR